MHGRPETEITRPPAHPAITLRPLFLFYVPPCFRARKLGKLLRECFPHEPDVAFAGWENPPRVGDYALNETPDLSQARVLFGPGVRRSMARSIRHDALHEIVGIETPEAFLLNRYAILLEKRRRCQQPVMEIREWLSKKGSSPQCRLLKDNLGWHLPIEGAEGIEGLVRRTERCLFAGGFDAMDRWIGPVMKVMGAPADEAALADKIRAAMTLPVRDLELPEDWDHPFAEDRILHHTWTARLDAKLDWLERHQQNSIFGGQAKPEG